MPIESKIDHASHQSLATAFKALGHPARLELLDLLAKRNSCVCGELVDEMPLSQATVSQHLKVLKEAGLITIKLDGSRRCYCLNTERLAELRHTVARTFDEMAQRCCIPKGGNE